LDELEEEDNDLPAFRSAGTLGTPSSSRARMLSQQREILMKKRSSSMQNGGEKIFEPLLVYLMRLYYRYGSKLHRLRE
jgi:hypothetical protein